MINDLIKYFENNKVLILGFGKEGESTYKLIRKYLKDKHLYIADKKEPNLQILQNDKNVTIISGENYLNNLQNYDVIMKSPGISFADIDTSKYFYKIKSQIELLLEFFNFFTIGITGTKGKSTTSSLIHQILVNQNIKSILLGNIGIPVFDYIDTIKEDMTVVLEMSSHQLEYMKVSPNIAVLLNIYEEHLDYYKSFKDYAKAKCNIFKYQKKSDYLLYNSDIEILNNLIKNAKADTYKVSFKGNFESDIYFRENKIYFDETPIYSNLETRNLLGDYNLNNIMFALAISKILELDMTKTIKTINEFKTLEHRLEFVGKYDGVLYYDNSIGTVPIATIEAVKALKCVDTLIIGGMDRGIDYNDFINFLNESEIRNIICMPKTGHDIAKKLKSEKSYVVNTLEEAVQIAKKVTQKEKICLLSPAAASYGFFKNFEEKGNLYKNLLKV